MKYIVLVYICVIDINKKIIPEKGFLTLMIIGLLKSLINNNIAGYYLGICAFSMPLLILYIAEDYVKKELIGFGDIKLMMALGVIFTYKTLEEIIRFYMLLYILSGIFTYNPKSSLLFFSSPATGAFSGMFCSSEMLI